MKISRKVFFVGIIIGLVLIATSINSKAATSGDYEYKINDDGNTIEIVKYDGQDDILYIPNEIGGKKVTKIGRDAFSYQEWVKEVYIPESVLSICDKAFENAKVENVFLSDGVTSIGDYAFAGSCLKSVYIPDSVTNIGEYAFADCEYLEKIILPNNIVKLNDALFSMCQSLKEIELPSNVQEIGAAVFEDCHNLIKIEIPTSVNKIGERAFAYCDSLSDICIPDGIIEIPAYMFYFCENLRQITWKKGIKTIGDHAFEYCSNLTQVDIPDGVTKIGTFAFDECSRLTKITIPKSVKTIECLWGKSSATVYCYSGSAAHIYSKSNNIPYKLERTQSIEGANVIKITGICNKIYNGKKIQQSDMQVFFNKKELILNEDYKCNYYDNENVGTAKIKITGIGEYSGSIIKTFVVAPVDISRKNVSVSGIPKEVLYTGSIYTYPNMKVKIGNTILTYGKNYSIKYYNNKNAGTARLVITGKGNYKGSIKKNFKIKLMAGSTYKVGNLKYKITKLEAKGKGAVALVGTSYKRSSKKFTSLIVPDNVIIGGVRFAVNSIGDNAFSGYKNLKKVSIGANVMSLGKNAFKSCGSLQSVLIGKNVRLISDYVFADCRKLAKMTIKTSYLTKNSVRIGAFRAIYKKITIKVPANKLGTYKKVLYKRGVPGSARITTK